jgi:hypothetical protein
MLQTIHHPEFMAHSGGEQRQQRHPIAAAAAQLDHPSSSCCIPPSRSGASPCRPSRCTTRDQAAPHGIPARAQPQPHPFHHRPLPHATHAPPPFPPKGRAAIIPLSMDDASVMASHPDVLHATKPYQFDYAGAGRALDTPVELVRHAVPESGPASRLAPVLMRSNEVSGDILSRVLG